MPRNAVISDATLRVKFWGDQDFSGFIVAGETQLPLNPGAVPLEGELLAHQTVGVAGDFVLLSPAEQTAADAEVAAEEQALVKGAAIVGRTVADASELPVPPPMRGLFVGMADGGLGVPALAISGNANWFIFDRDRTFP